MPPKEISTTSNERIHWLDNLRSFMIFLVIVLHASVVYEKTGMGAFWWIVIDPSTSDVPGIIFLILAWVVFLIVRIAIYKTT